MLPPSRLPAFLFSAWVFLFPACSTQPPGPPFDAGAVDASAHAIPSSRASSAPSATASIVPARSTDPLAGANILAEVTLLADPAYRGRGSGTEDEARAATWIAGQLDEAKLPPAFGQRTVPFTYGGKQKSANVLGLLTKEDAPTSVAIEERGVVLVGAHYDHVGIVNGELYPGAEDNASGVAVVLAIARALASRRAELGRPVVFAFFGAEEAGLNGSHALVRDWPFSARPISTMVNIDMIGRTLVDQPALWFGARMTGVLSDVDPELAVGALATPGNAAIAARARDACSAEGIRAVMIDDLPGSLKPYVSAMAKGRGDHVPFEARGVPYVFFSSSESVDYHKPTDTADRLDARILEARARAILRFVIASSNAP